MPNILRIDSSAKPKGSVTSALLDEIEASVGKANVRRDLGGNALPQIDGTWVGSNFTPEGDRTYEQREALSLSDTLIAEIEAADTLLIALPVYNFSVPGSLKTWIDLVCRAGKTFKYTESGPVGLLSGKRVIVAVASGGTPVGSEIDFATGYFRHIMGFIGLTDVTFIAADQQNRKGDAAVADAKAEIGRLAA